MQSTGTWAIVLGLLNIIITTLLRFLLYAQSNLNGKDRATLVITELAIGLIVGGRYFEQVQFDRSTDQFSIQGAGTIPSALVTTIDTAISNPYFQAYASAAW